GPTCGCPGRPQTAASFRGGEYNTWCATRERTLNARTVSRAAAQTQERRRHLDEATLEGLHARCIMHRRFTASVTFDRTFRLSTEGGGRGGRNPGARQPPAVSIRGGPGGRPLIGAGSAGGAALIASTARRMTRPASPGH